MADGKQKLPIQSHVWYNPAMNTLLTPAVNRRDFITRSAQVAAAGLLGSAFGAPSPATSETLVQQLYGSMDDAQRKTLF